MTASSEGFIVLKNLKMKVSLARDGQPLTKLLTHLIGIWSWQLKAYVSLFFLWPSNKIYVWKPCLWQLISVQFSRSVVSDSLRPHESQHARPSCPSPNPGVHSDSCPSSRWCHPAISSSVAPFSSCPQSLPASGSFPMSQLFAWGGQSTVVSALASFLRYINWNWTIKYWMMGGKKDSSLLPFNWL